MLERVRSYAGEQALWQRGEKIVCGVSGGMDSVALLHLLARVATCDGVQVVAAHYDHALRGAASQEDARFVRGLCASWGIALFEGVWRHDVMPKGNREEEARRHRYAFFDDVLRQTGFSLLALAHHQDDQAETVLLHLLRGAGLAGLSGMAPRTRSLLSHGDVIRPFLCVSRKEIQAYCRENALPHREDESNEDGSNARGRLRALLPSFASVAGDGFAANICRSAFLARQADDALRAHCAPLAAMVEYADGRVFLPNALFAAERALCRYVIHGACVRLGLNVSQAAVARVLSLSSQETGKQADVADGFVALRTASGVLMSARKAPEEAACPFAAGGETVAGGALWRLSAVEGVPPSLAPRGDILAYLDASAVGGSLMLRPVKAGDRWRPLGAPGSRTVGDCFTDKKIDREARARALALESGGRLLFVEGLGIAECARVRDGGGPIWALEKHALEE